MTILRSRPAAALALAAALSLSATPAMARGWGHRHHDRGGVDAGDIFAGLLVIGGIAAIASAAGKKNKPAREGDYRYPDDRAGPEETTEGTWRQPQADYGRPGDDRGAPGYRMGGNLDAAVDQCAAEVERGDRRVDGVDAVNRDGEGWRVEGRVDGRPFTCSVDGDGRVRGVSVDGDRY